MADWKHSIEISVEDYNFCARPHRMMPYKLATLFINIFDLAPGTFYFTNA